MRDNSMFGAEAKKYGLDGPDGAGASAKAHNTAAKGQAAAKAQVQTRPAAGGRASRPYGPTPGSLPQGNYTAVPPPYGAGRQTPPGSPLANGYRTPGTADTTRIPPSTANSVYPTARQQDQDGKPSPTGLRSSLSSLSLVLSIWGMVTLFSGTSLMLALVLLGGAVVFSVASLIGLRGYTGKSRAVVSLLLSGLFLAFAVWLFYTAADWLLGALPW